jgi:hypothetical protein
MDIKEFVSETLSQIIDGVVDAQGRSQPRSAVVAPFYGCRQNVRFDVAVTVAEGKEVTGKAGISVWSIGAGGSAKSETSSSTVSRIQFEIPIELPKGSECPHEPTDGVRQDLLRI